MQVHALSNILTIFAVVVATVATHSAGALALVWWMIHDEPEAERRFGFLYNTGVWIVVNGVFIVLHLIEVAWWGLYYELLGYFPDYSTALYFSAITYTTLGYGDVLLPRESRLIGGVEALTGMLMMAWSAAIMVRLASWMYDRRIKRWREFRSGR
jgi:hypothetical protein